MTWAYYSAPAVFKKNFVKFSEYEEPGVSESESESADSEHELDTPSGSLHFTDIKNWIKLLFFLTAFTTTATEASMTKDLKVIVSFSQLQQLIPTMCITWGCDATLSATEKFRGCGVVIYMRCSNGHTFTWSSLPQHHDARGSSIYSNNLLIAAACLTSGNSYAKIDSELFCRFMGLKVISEAMYYRYRLELILIYWLWTKRITCRYQNAYLEPSIKKFWKKNIKKRCLHVCQVQISS